MAENPDRARRRRGGDEEGWWILPVDVLLLVFARLPAVDVVRCGAVCASWRSAVKRGHLSSRTIRPWLLLSKLGYVKDPCVRFLDTNTGETYSIRLPELHHRYLVGKSDHGFLVYRDILLPGRLYMINPITRETVCLPPLPRALRRYTRVFVVYSSPPPPSSSSSSSSGEGGATCSGYTAVIRLVSGGICSVFADAGNLESWSRVSSTLDRVSEFAHHVCGKKICGLLQRSDLRFLRLFSGDLHDPVDFKLWDFPFESYPWSLLDDISETSRRCKYHPVVLPDGNLIVVYRATVYGLDTFLIEVYRMPADPHGVVEMATGNSIGNFAVFLDEYNSLVMSTPEFPELKAGTIYFSDDSRHVNADGEREGPFEGLVMFDLEAQETVEYHPVSMDFWDIPSFTWFMPAL